MTLLSSKNLVKSYQGSNTNALDYLTLAVEKGEFLGLLGQNGSGKTTFLDIVCDLNKPTSGKITCHIDRAKMALVPQELALYPNLTLTENFYFFAKLYGLSRKTAKQRLVKLADMVQLSDQLDKKIKHLSGGQKRRANLALSLLNEPELLLLDEPMVNVDVQSRNIIMQNLVELNKNGCTIVYTSHYLEEIYDLCSRVIILEKGRIVEQGDPKQLVAKHPEAKNLTDLFLKVIADIS